MVGYSPWGHKETDTTEVTEQYSIVHMYHIFIHSSFVGPLGCFHVLAVVNSAAMNTGVHVSFRIIVLSGYMPWRRQWHPTPVLLPGKAHGWRSLVGYSPWGR